MPTEVHIHDLNAHEFTQDVHIDGERKSRGLIPRDYNTHPAGCYASAPITQIEMPLIDPSEYDARLADKIAQKALLSDIRMAGNAGQMIPSLDQNGKGYCVLADSLIRMGDNTQKRIVEVKVGDEVYTAEGNKGKVKQCHVRDYKGPLAVVSVHGSKRTLRLTPNHEILTKRGYTPADMIYQGDEVKFDNGYPWTLLKSVDSEPYEGKVYNIGVEGDNSYIADGFGVHNCWAHSSVSAVLMMRAVMNEPYVPLSAYAVACIIKHFQDEGGWGALSLDFITQRGVPSSEFWPMKSMDRANDNPNTWKNAAQHKVTAGWVDMSADPYDRKLTFAQIITLLLSNVPVVGDFNWWSHSVCLLDAVSGKSQRKKTRGRTGKLLPLMEFDRVWGMDNPVTGGYGVRILNNWGDQWSDHGMGLLSGQKAIPDGAVAPRDVMPAAA